MAGEEPGRSARPATVRVPERVGRGGDRCPDPPDEALARFVLAGDGDQPGLWRRWCELVELDDASNASHELLPSAYLRLEACAPDDPDLGRLRGLYRQRWVLGQRHLALAERAMRTLETANLVFLGPADHDALHAVIEPLVLPLRTPRLTVPEHQLRDSLDVMLDAGWLVRRDSVRPSIRSRLIQSEWSLEQVASGPHVVLGVHFNPEINDTAYTRGVWARSNQMTGGRNRPAATDLFLALLTEAAHDPEALRWSIGSLALARQHDVFPDADSIVQTPGFRHLLEVVVSRLGFLTSVDPTPDSLDRILAAARSALTQAESRARPRGIAARQWMHRSRQARVLAASVRRHGGIRSTIGYLRATRR